MLSSIKKGGKYFGSALELARKHLSLEDVRKVYELGKSELSNHKNKNRSQNLDPRDRHATSKRSKNSLFADRSASDVSSNESQEQTSKRAYYKPYQSRKARDRSSSFIGRYDDQSDGLSNESSGQTEYMPTMKPPRSRRKNNNNNQEKRWFQIALYSLVCLILGVGIFGAGYKLSQLRAKKMGGGSGPGFGKANQGIMVVHSIGNSVSSTIPPLDLSDTQTTTETTKIFKKPKTTFKTTKKKLHTTTKASKKLATTSNRTSFSEYMEPHDKQNDCPKPKPSLDQIKVFVAGKKMFLDNTPGSSVKTMFISPVVTHEQLLHDCSICPIEKNFLIHVASNCIFTKKPDEQCMRICDPKLSVQPIKECLSDEELKKRYVLTSEYDVNKFHESQEVITAVCMQRLSISLGQEYRRAQGSEATSSNNTICGHVPRIPSIRLEEVAVVDNKTIGCKGLV